MKTYKQSTSGRSMIEMLGVLAIIGVLSAGGVWGYNLAMESHKVNQYISMIGHMLLSTDTHTFFNNRVPHDTWYNGVSLCRMGVIPSDRCKGNAVIGYWNENMTIYLVKKTDDDSHNTILTNGTRFMVSGTHLRLKMGSPFINLSTGACEKILTHQGWKNFETLSIVTGIVGGVSARYQLPLTPAGAKEACPVLKTNPDTWIAVYFAYGKKPST